MGFTNADIYKQDDEYIYKGGKNTDIYRDQLQVQLLERVSITFNVNFSQFRPKWIIKNFHKSG